MSLARRQRGIAGEQIAARFLTSLGYEILHRNLRLGRNEIDLICRDGDCLVFVEVKHARSGACGHPATWVNERKKDRLRQAAARYLDEFPVSRLDLRFDVVTIDRGLVEHYPNAF